MLPRTPQNRTEKSAWPKIATLTRAGPTVPC
jgi:hypothetical protein